MTPLQTAAQQVIEQWDAPLWKNTISTAHFIGELRKALEAEQAQAVEPVGYLNLASVKLPGEKHPACEFSYERNNNAAAAIPLYIHPAPPAQAVGPVATVQCINGVTIGYLDAMQPVGTKLYTHPAPPPATGERAELIARLRMAQAMMEYNPIEAHDAMGSAADMLEADAQELEATERQVEILSDDLSKCSKAQQVAVLEKREPLNRVDILNMHALRCWPRTMFADKSYGIALDTVTVVDFVRIIEAHHGIGAKP